MKLKTKILTARWGDGALREAWVFAGFLNNLSRFERLAARKCFFGLIIRVGLLEVVYLFVHKEINSWCLLLFSIILVCFIAQLSKTKLIRRNFLILLQILKDKCIYF